MEGEYVLLLVLFELRGWRTTRVQRTKVLRKYFRKYFGSTFESTFVLSYCVRTVALITKRLQLWQRTLYCTTNVPSYTFCTCKRGVLHLKTSFWTSPTVRVHVHVHVVGFDRDQTKLSLFKRVLSLGRARFFQSDPKLSCPCWTEDDVKPGAKGRGGIRSGLFCHLSRPRVLQTKYLDPCVQVGYE